MIEVFKTNVADQTQSQALLLMFSMVFSKYSVHFDLADCDKVMRIEAPTVDVKKVIMIFTDLGYECELLN